MEPFFGRTGGFFSFLIARYSARLDTRSPVALDPVKTARDPRRLRHSPRGHQDGPGHRGVEAPAGGLLCACVHHRPAPGDARPGPGDLRPAARPRSQSDALRPDAQRPRRPGPPGPGRDPGRPPARLAPGSGGYHDRHDRGPGRLPPRRAGGARGGRPAHGRPPAAVPRGGEPADPRSPGRRPVRPHGTLAGRPAGRRVRREQSPRGGQHGGRRPGLPGPAPRGGGRPAGGVDHRPPPRELRRAPARHFHGPAPAGGELSGRALDLPRAPEPQRARPGLRDPGRLAQPRPVRSARLPRAA